MRAHSDLYIQFIIPHSVEYGKDNFSCHKKCPHHGAGTSAYRKTTLFQGNGAQKYTSSRLSEAQKYTSSRLSEAHGGIFFFPMFCHVGRSLHSLILGRDDRWGNDFLVGRGHVPAAACRKTVSLRASPQTGVAIPRIFKHLSSKNSWFSLFRRGLPHQPAGWFAMTYFSGAFFDSRAGTCPRPTR